MGDYKKEISRLRSEVRNLQKNAVKVKPFLGSYVDKVANPFTGIVSGNYWTQTGMPWVSSEGRKAVLTEWFWQPIRGQPRRVDTNELRQFSQTYWIHACVKTIIDEINSLDWDIIPREDTDYERVASQIEELKEWLKYPNKNQEPFNNIIRALVKDIMELDAGVIVKVYSIDSYDFDHLEPKSGAPLLKDVGQRKLLELYARDGASFLKETDKFGFVRGYWQYSYQIPAHPMWFNKDEIIYISETPRSTSVYGFARTQAILDQVKSLHYSTLYNKRFFEEYPLPEGLISVKDTNEAEMQTLMDWWVREFKAQPHKLGIINKELSWQQFTIPNKELEFLETQKQYFKFVIAMFGLTPTELGLTEEVNRATATTQAELTKRKGIRPLLKLIENFINAELIPEFGVEGVEFTYIYDDPQEKAAKLSNWKMEIDMGIKTPNEVREELGLAPIDGGDSTGQEKLIDTDVEDNTPDAKPKKNTEQIKRRESKIERDNTVTDPYSLANSPVGSNKGFKKYMENVNKNLFMDMITNAASMYGLSVETVQEGFEHELEHASTVGNNVNTILQIALDHLKEDAEYYIKLRQIEKGIDDGQYYHEPFEVIQPPRGKIVQPQNNPMSDKPINPNIQQFQDGDVVTSNCPQCAFPTLHLVSSADDVGRSNEYHCTNCGATMDEQEAMDRGVLAHMFSQMEENNSTKPINKPEWSPK